VFKQVFLFVMLGRYNIYKSCTWYWRSHIWYGLNVEERVVSCKFVSPEIENLKLQGTYVIME